MASKTENRKIYISINGKEVEHSYGGIRKEVNRLSRELDKLTPGTKEFTDKKRDLDQVKKKFDEVATATGRTNRGLKQSSNLLGGMKGLVAGAFSIAAIGSFVNKIIGVRSEFEKYLAVLTTSLGTSKAANKEFAMIRDFAAETPYSVRELTESFVKLTNQGFKPSREELVLLGDLAASTGKSFDQLSEAIIDAQTGEFERLKEFGIRAEKHGDKVQFAFRGMKTEVDFTADSIQKYLLSLGEMEGITGSMVAISETLGGKISNLGDSWDKLLYNLGESSIIKNTVDVLTRLLDVVNSAVESTKTFEDQVRSVQAELNLEMQVLQDANLTQEQRSSLIAEINQQYGEYLPYLLDEQSSLEDLRKAHQDINRELEARIAMKAFEEELTELAERQVQAAKAIHQAEIDRAKLRTENQLGRNDLTPGQMDVLLGLSQSLEGINRDLIENADTAKAEIEAKYMAIFETLHVNMAEVRARMKAAEDEGNEERVSSTRETEDQIVLARKSSLEEQLTNELDHQAELKAVVDQNVEIVEKGEDLKQRAIEETARLQSQALNNLVGDLQTAAKAFPGLAMAAKRAAQLQALVDTYASAQLAFKAMAGIPVAGPALGAIAAATALAAGLARVAAIENASYAEGGFTGSGSGQPDGTGYKRAGYVHEDEWVAPRWMKQSPMYASTINSLEYARANNIGRYGGATKTINNNSTVNNTVVSENMELAVAELRATIREMREKGLPVIASDRFYRDMKEVEDLHNAITDKTQF